MVTNGVSPLLLFSTNPLLVYGDAPVGPKGLDICQVFRTLPFLNGVIVKVLFNYLIAHTQCLCTTMVNFIHISFTTMVLTSLDRNGRRRLLVFVYKSGFL